MVDEFEAEGALGLESSAVAVEEKQAEIKVYQVGLLCQVLFDEGYSLLQILYST